jgi:predicted ArsR family transcriptional regulator
LEKIAHQLESQAEIIANFQQREQVASYNADLVSTILQTIKRRPCTVGDLSSILRLHQNEINKYIETLLNRNLIRSEILERGVFFKSNKE